MKIILLRLLIVVLFYAFNLTAQDILWKKNYGLNTADDFGQSVIEGNDGNIVIAGYTGSYGAGGSDVWLIKTDENGDTLWTRTYGGAGDDYGYSLKQTGEGGYIIGGATSSYGVGGFDFYLIRTDSLGDTLWTRTYGGVNDDYCRDIAVTDSGYILVGEKNFNLPFKPDIWIMKFNNSGDRVWDKIFGETGDDRASTIIKISDARFMIGGHWNFGGTLIKIDQFGDTLWSKRYPSTYGSFNSIDQLPNGDFIITCHKWGGINSWDLGLLKTDSLGNEIWSENYDYHEDADIGYSVQQTSDGGYIVCGSGEWDIDYGWIIRTNEFGDTLWTKLIESYTLSPLANADTYCQSVIQAQNGDYIIAGSQTQISFQKEAMLLRISSDIVPVELTSFTATAERNSVSLNWQTVTETNNSGFKIERKQVGSPQSSVSNQDWNQIAFVPGFGTTTEPKSYSFTDENLSSGKYQYRFKQIDFDGTFEYSQIVEVEITAPLEFSLKQNYPNPFNPTTRIKYTIPTVTLSLSKGDILVSLKVFDVLGNETATLVNETQQPGIYEVEFNVGQAISLSSGVYYYQLRVYPVSGAGGFIETKKMILLR